MRTFTEVNGPLLRLNAIAYALVSPAAMLTAALGAGLLFVAEGWADAPTVLAFVLLAVAITAPFMAVAHAPQAFAAARAAASGVAEMLELPVLSRPGTSREVPADPEVRFENVTFGYDPDRPVLHDIDVRLPVGGLTALVGPSGSGKSTLASLLPRFADPQRGRITLGGVDLRDMAADELYRHVSFVFQDSGLLSTVTHAGRILVLDGGKIVERGDHRRLLSAGGRYAVLWNQGDKARFWTLSSAVSSPTGNGNTRA